MTIIRKFLFSAGLLGLLCLFLPGPARADTIYTYNSATLQDGSTFTITLDFSAPLTISQAGLSPSPQSWTMVDPGHISLSSTTGYLAQLSLSTDSSGGIVQPWVVRAYDSPVNPSVYIASQWDVLNPGSEDSVGYGGASYYTKLIGEWGVPYTKSTAAPEPSTFSLLFVGLLGLGLLAGVKRYQGNHLQTQE